MKLLRIVGTSYNTLKQLVVKTIGAKATYTAEEYSSWGVDSRPPNGTTALYTRTEADGDEAIIAYLIKNRLAEVGELRLFSTSANGTLQTYIWLKADGTIQLGGVSNGGLVKIDNLKTQYDAGIAAIKAAVAAGFSAQAGIDGGVGLSAFNTAAASIANLNKTPLQNTDVKH